jgi:MFS family permease
MQTKINQRFIRLLSVLMALDMVENMISPVLWIFGEQRSVLATITTLSSSAHALAWAWLAAAALMLPYLIAQLTDRASRRATRLACLALSASGVLWMYVAFLARNLDYQYVGGLFIFDGLVCLALAGVLANSINDAQLLEAGDSHAA